MEILLKTNGKRRETIVFLNFQQRKSSTSRIGPFSTCIRNPTVFNFYRTSERTTCKCVSSILYACFSSIGSQLPDTDPLNHEPLIIGAGFSTR